ncbi:LGFP repeat-containing protein [Gordonia hongkongensis]|uniref:LGFP repeat-containing protein n=1 Tax=Gordonia hongkongensis TaxID=1701090 RepID=UPI001FFB396E|nr:hypothetical protein [Gordonia hongkongensis]UPG70829.1 hypothetical protein MVF96_24380 [Gordonia hongkongensis]
MQDNTTSEATAAATTLEDAAPAVQAFATTAAVAAGCQIYPPTTFQVCGAIRDKYNQMGGPTSFLLFPKSNELTNPGNTGKRSEFIGGNIYWSAATGAHPVAHEFLFKWGDHGYETGFLKYPKTDEIVLSDGISRRQEFQGGHIYWSPATGAHSIQGLIYDKWKALGAQTGVLKFPTSDEIVAPDGKGRFTTFQGGAIYWHPNTGAHAVSGAVYAFWAFYGYEAGQYGYPIAAAVTDQNGTRQEFQNGTISLFGDGFLQGIRKNVADDEQIYGWETQLKNAYPPVDLSEYDIIADPTGELKQSNRLLALAIGQWFSSHGYTTAKALWDHYYENTGADFHITDDALLDAWMNDDSRPEGVKYPSPVQIRANNRDRTVAAAIARADQTGQPAKVSGFTDWTVTVGSGDLNYSLGHFSLSCTTVVVAYPGQPGKHRIKLLQQAHVVDVYDFDWIEDPDDLADGGNNVGYTGMTRGVAKPFLSWGSASKIPWEGQR